MRITSVVILLVLTTALSANAGGPPAANSVSLPPSFTFDFGSEVERSDLLSEKRQEVHGRRSGPTENYNDSVCATMRTYVVARVQRDSDSTQIVGYSRCQPAWKFQLRTADESRDPSLQR